MDIFINKTHLVLCSPERFNSTIQFQTIIDLKLDSIKYNQLQGLVLLKNPSIEQTKEIIRLVIADKLENIPNITLLSENFIHLKDAVKKEFRIIEAGGGLVRKDDKLLMIYRLGKWDLPKGKRDNNEKLRQTALREVEEECNIRAELDYKLCTTWHYYLMGNKVPTLKKTRWYLMNCTSDAQMKPQIEEDITDIRWMVTEEVNAARQNTYPAIDFVFNAYQNQSRTT